MDRILIILKKENGPRASSAPALGLNTIIFKYVYWYMKQISGERLQDHWSSGFLSLLQNIDCGFLRVPTVYVFSKNIKNIKNFPMKFSIFAFEKFLCILHGHVFVMTKFVQLVS